MNLAWYWTALIAFVIVNFLLISASVLVYAERKVSGYIAKNRPGPNRVGPFGFLQPFADVVKLVFKENIVPALANPFVHSLAPMMMVVIAMTAGALIPFAHNVVIADMDVSVLVLLALYIYFRIRSYAGWMEFQQQVLPPWRTSFKCPDDLL